MITVDSVQNLQAAAKRHVTVRFRDAVDVSEFDALPGVEKVIAEADHLHMTVSGTLDAVVKAAARHTVVDFVSQPADLEEIFFDVYRASADEDHG
jgi:ABC-2 type transport system ATP-binding protein